MGAYLSRTTKGAVSCSETVFDETTGRIRVHTACQRLTHRGVEFLETESCPSSNSLERNLRLPSWNLTEQNEAVGPNLIWHWSFAVQNWPPKLPCVSILAMVATFGEFAKQDACVVTELKTSCVITSHIWKAINKGWELVLRVTIGEKVWFELSDRTWRKVVLVLKIDSESSENRCHYVVAWRQTDDWERRVVAIVVGTYPETQMKLSLVTCTHQLVFNPSNITSWQIPGLKPKETWSQV